MLLIAWLLAQFHKILGEPCAIEPIVPGRTHRRYDARVPNIPELAPILNGSNRTFQLGDEFMLEHTPGNLQLEDVNGDRIPDIVTFAGSGGEAVTLEGSGDGRFSPPVPLDPNPTLEQGTRPVRPVDGLGGIQY